MNFDSNGNLEPYEKITTDLTTFEKTFVTDFPNSETRKKLFDNYLRYLEDFSKEMTPNFTQWINGSFVTLKENPKDLDFVTFIDSKLYDEKEQLLDSKFISSVTYNDGLDAFIMKNYPNNVAAYQTYTLFHTDLWFHRFTNSRKNLEKKSFSKGFIEINF